MKLSLYKPVKPYFLNQAFGANIPCVIDDDRIPLPLRPVVSGSDNKTCPAGYMKLYPLLGLPKGHSGLDLRAGVQPVYSSHEGKVSEISLDPARGLGVGISSVRLYECEGGVYRVKTRYWHLKQVEVTLGQSITPGMRLGLTDTTGYSSGSHLHFELKIIATTATGNEYNVFQDNGWYGAVDPLPYLSDQYAEDIPRNRKIILELIRILTVKFQSYLAKKQ